MMYLDYASHTPVDLQVLDAFASAAADFAGNPNSNHPLGAAAKTYYDSCIKRIADAFSVQEAEVILTSGASESNNLAIKGVCEAYKRSGRHIVTTYLEHSSVTAPVSYLAQQGYEVDFVDLRPDGQVDLEHLEELLREDTVLVSIGQVDSEIGLIQQVNTIGKLLKKYEHTFFHVDATQAVGKIPVSMEDIDLLTFSPHKFYGIAGSGVLIKRAGIRMEQQIHGGISASSFRSGTPVLPMAAATAEALTLALNEQQTRYDDVTQLYNRMHEVLDSCEGIEINSGVFYSPYILNFSIVKGNAAALQEALGSRGFCLSSKSACCAVNSPSRPVYALTKNKKRALSTLRIGFSHLIGVSDLEEFIAAFQECYQALDKQ